MRKNAMLAAAILGLLTLAAACSGADAVLDPQTTPGGGTPPTTVDGGSQNVDGDSGSSQLGTR